MIMMMAAATLSSSSSWAARYAVVGVGVDADDSVADLAAEVRATLGQHISDAVVIDAAELEAKLKAPAGAVVDIATAKGLLDAAETAFNAV